MNRRKFIGTIAAACALAVIPKAKAAEPTRIIVMKGSHELFRNYTGTLYVMQDGEDISQGELLYVSKTKIRSDGKIETTVERWKGPRPPL